VAELSEALKEAYASNPVGQVIIETLEFRHPSFIDDNGNPAALRVVRDYQAVFVGLEATAPLQPGETVEFMAFAFDITLPGFEENQTPQLSITIDNVGRELITQLEAATSSQQPIEVTYRPYLLSDLSGPQMDPPITMTVTNAVADVFQIQMDATLDDVSNQPFPRRQYTPQDFPGLVR
jgi:hypothetical protein